LGSECNQFQVICPYPCPPSNRPPPLSPQKDTVTLPSRAAAINNGIGSAVAGVIGLPPPPPLPPCRRQRRAAAAATALLPPLTPPYCPTARHRQAAAAASNAAAALPPPPPLYPRRCCHLLHYWVYLGTYIGTYLLVTQR
jgi:hypothetical protein